MTETLTILMWQKLQEPWDGIEAPATVFARGDRIEKQLVKTGQAASLMLCLAFALASTYATGEYKNTLQEWYAKGDTIKTFPNFWVYIQNEFSKKTKHSKTSAQSGGHGIANSTNNKMDKVDEAEVAALANAEVANAMQAQ